MRPEQGRKGVFESMVLAGPTWLDPSGGEGDRKVVQLGMGMNPERPEKGRHTMPAVGMAVWARTYLN